MFTTRSVALTAKPSQSGIAAPAGRLAHRGFASPGLSPPAGPALTATGDSCANRDLGIAFAGGEESRAQPVNRRGAQAPRWEEKELRAAVEQSTSWADLLKILGYKPSSTTVRRALRRESQLYGIDTGHFVGQRTWSDQDLIEAAAAARTWAELLTALRLSPNSRSCDSVRAASRRLGVELGHITLGPKAGRQGIGIDLYDRLSLVNLRNAAPSIVAAWFLASGRAVSFPPDSTVYDLVVDLPHGLKRVQVKSTTWRDSHGRWIVIIGHRPERSSKISALIPYGADDVDFFLAVDGDLMIYLIPAREVAGKITLVLRSYSNFTVGNARSLMETINPGHRNQDSQKECAG
jgi:hypothetical protein